MLAWEVARQWYQDNSCTESFEDRLGWHLSCGLVYSTPSAFLLASEVAWDHQISTLDSRPSTQPNAWYVDLAVLQGSPMSLLLQVATRPHKWVLFRRNNGLKIHAYQWDRLAKKVAFSR